MISRTFKNTDYLELASALHTSNVYAAMPATICFEFSIKYKGPPESPLKIKLMKII